MKYFLFVFSLLALLYVPHITSAQTTSVTNISITDVQFAKSEYKAGEKIEGSFVVANDDATDFTDLSFTYALIRTNPNNGVIEDAFGLIATTDPVFVAGNSKVTIPISFAIPLSGNSDNLRFAITATLNSGQTIAFHHQPITVTGFLSSVAITDSYITVGDKEYDMQEGPMIKDVAPAAHIYLANDSTEVLSLTPSLKVKVLSADRAIVDEQSFAAVTVPAKGSAHSTITLPIVDKPGVYFSEISLLDTNGNPRASNIFARYIIAGDIATIPSIIVDKKQVERGESITATVTYTGGPVDIETGRPTQSEGMATLSLTLKNEKGNVIGEASEEVDLNTLNAKKNFVLTASKDAQAVSAEAVITKDGKELARYAVALASPDSYQTESTTTALWIISILVLLFGVALAVLLKKRNPTTIVVLLIITIASIFSFSSSVSAATYSNSASSEFNFTASAYVNKTTYLPGESVSAQIQGVSLAAAVCSNVPRNVTNTYSLVGNPTVNQSWSDNSGASNHGKTNWSSSLITFPSSSAINAPTAPGTYDLNVNVTLQTNFAFPGGPYPEGGIIPFSEYPEAQCVADGNIVRTRPAYNNGQPGCFCNIGSNGCTGRTKTITLPIVIPITVACSATSTWNGSTCVPNPTPSCGTATSTASFNFPSSNLCGAGNTVSNQVTSTTNSPHTWTCSVEASNTSCSAPRCASNQTFCSATNSCLANGVTCGSLTNGVCGSSTNTCNAGTFRDVANSPTQNLWYCDGIGGGTNASCSTEITSGPTGGSCLLSTNSDIAYSLLPSIVDTPQDVCALTWDINYTNEAAVEGGTAVCSPNPVSCRLNGGGISNETISSQGGTRNVSPGTYTISCTDSAGGAPKVRSFQCRVNPNYGEF